MTPKFDLLVEKIDITDDKRNIINRMDSIDKIQLALDVAGIEPSVGTIADAANIVISLGRMLNNVRKKETSEVKRHAINAGISAISLIPLGDVAKLLKIRTLARKGKIGKAAAKASISGLRSAKTGLAAVKQDRAEKSLQSGEFRA